MNEIKLERKKAYKNTDPMTTVNRIRQILYKNNIFVIEVSQKIEPVTGVCSCRIILGDESVRSLNIGSNGKGMNAQYSLASAYAEFMERLQNGATLWKVLGITDYMVRSRDYSREQMIGFAEEMFKRAYDPSENYHDIATAYIDSGNYREAVVFDEVNGQGKITVPSGLFNKMTGSNGMAAGNTYKEAIIQGLSEIFERYAISKMFLEEITPPTVCEDIFNETDVIKRLKRLKIVGVNYKILDCSLGINIPVLALLIEKGGKYHIHYGADPSPITALERCLTEIFQGRNIEELPLYEPYYEKDDLQKKFKNEEKEYTDSTGKVPAWIIENEPTYSFEGFIHPVTVSDDDDLSFYIRILDSLGKKLYVRDCGYLGFPTVRLYVPGMTENHCPSPEDCISAKTEEDIVQAVRRLPSLSEDEVMRLCDKIGSTINLAQMLPPGDFPGRRWDDRQFKAAILIKAGQTKAGMELLDSYIADNYMTEKQAELMKLHFKIKKVLFRRNEWPDCPDCDTCSAVRKCKKEEVETLDKALCNLLSQ